MDDPAATTTASLACSLPVAEMSDRMDRWRALTEEALGRTVEPGRVVSTYPRTEDIAARLRELIGAEVGCCPFLVFDVRETHGSIEVELRYPPEFEPMVAMIVP